MKVSQLSLAGVALIELDLHGDGRGFFVERFNEHRFRHHGLPSYFCQDNHSRSAPERCAVSITSSGRLKESSSG